VSKTLRVTGNREWRCGIAGATLSDPEPFEHMPIVYERAFGGWDRSAADPADHRLEARNPVGMGFLHRSEGTIDTRLPNVEHPGQLMSGRKDKPEPAGFNAVDCSWTPRRELAGTYDDAWRARRFPLWAEDYDARYGHCADGSRIDFLVCMLRTEAPEPFEAATAPLPSIATLAGLLGKRMNNPTLRQVLVPLGLDRQTLDSSEQVVDLRRTYGLRLTCRKAPGTTRGSAATLVLHGIDLMRVGEFESRGWHGELPRGIVFDDSPEAAISKIGRPFLRARALRLAGDLGRLDLLPQCLAQLGDDDPACGFHAACSALLLGDRQTALHHLQILALASGGFQAAAASLFFKLASPAQARPLLAELSRQPAQSRILIQGIAFAGDPHYVPWLIARMSELPLVRLAGQAFSFVTGADLAVQHLDTNVPDEWLAVPSEDPAATDTAMDEDESLPWPDPTKVDAWWRERSASFTVSTRYFLGQGISAAHCMSVLRSGLQRQRTAAADHMALLEPGAMRFNTAAAAWRQKRQLAQLGC